LKDRDVVLGVQLGGQSRAFPLAKVRGQTPIEDRMAGVPLVILTGPDGTSVRVFRSQWNGSDIELYRNAQTPDAQTNERGTSGQKTDEQDRASETKGSQNKGTQNKDSQTETGQSNDWRLLDSLGNTWNFAGCATSGPAAGYCLEKINHVKDYWFDWKNYNPKTTVYSH
jgi:hypothetical protein